jgi:hypothetical protein
MNTPTIVTAPIADIKVMTVLYLSIIFAKALFVLSPAWSIVSGSLSLAGLLSQVTLKSSVNTAFAFIGIIKDNIYVAMTSNIGTMNVLLIFNVFPSFLKFYYIIEIRKKFITKK